MSRYFIVIYVGSPHRIGGLFGFSVEPLRVARLVQDFAGQCRVNFVGQRMVDQGCGMLVFEICFGRRLNDDMDSLASARDRYVQQTDCFTRRLGDPFAKSLLPVN